VDFKIFDSYFEWWWRFTTFDVSSSHDIYIFSKGSKHPLGSRSYMVHQRLEYAKKFFPMTSKVRDCDANFISTRLYAPIPYLWS
jgi:hypothetical protein